MTTKPLLQGLASDAEIDAFLEGVGTAPPGPAEEVRSALRAALALEEGALRQAVEAAIAEALFLLQVPANPAVHHEARRLLGRLLKALLSGDSRRATLEASALDRLGAVEWAKEDARILGRAGADLTNAAKRQTAEAARAIWRQLGQEIAQRHPKESRSAAWLATAIRKKCRTAYPDSVRDADTIRRWLAAESWHHGLRTPN